MLQPRSLLVFSEPLYSNFLHSIEAQHTEVVPPHVLNAQVGAAVGSRRRGMEVRHPQVDKGGHFHAFLDSAA